MIINLHTTEIIKTSLSMKKFILILFLVQFSFANSLEDNKVPNSRIKMLNGNYAKLYDFNSDGPMIVNFWTTW